MAFFAKHKSMGIKELWSDRQETFSAAVERALKTPNALECYEALLSVHKSIKKEVLKQFDRKAVGISNHRATWLVSALPATIATIYTGRHISDALLSSTLAQMDVFGAVALGFPLGLLAGICTLAATNLTLSATLAGAQTLPSFVQNSFFNLRLKREIKRAETLAAEDIRNHWEEVVAENPNVGVRKDRIFNLAAVREKETADLHVGIASELAVKGGRLHLQRPKQD